MAARARCPLGAAPSAAALLSLCLSAAALHVGSSRDGDRVPVMNNVRAPSLGGKECQATEFYMDPPSMLRMFVQLQGKKWIKQEDIVYSSVQLPFQYQAIVILHCMDGKHLVGEPAATKMRAKANAARMALQSFGDQVATVLAHAKTTDLNKGPRALLTMFAQLQGNMTIKKGDIVYSSVGPSGQHLATVILNCMEGKHFVGKPAATNRQAEANAATIALQILCDQVAEVLLHELAKKTILNQDTGSLLNMFAQLQGIVYSGVEHPGHYEASVTLHCMEGKHFVGKPAATKKQAEQNAATMALQSFGDQVATVLAHANTTDPLDPKSLLFMFAQLQGKLQGKNPIKKEDMVYSSMEHPGQYEASVTFHCFEGKHFVGKPAATKKQAERNALTVALQAFRDKVATVLAHAKTTDSYLEPQEMLRRFAQLQGKKPIKKEDIVYSSVKHPGHYEASVILHCFEGKHFKGAPAETKSQAEANAATMALQSFGDQVATVLAHAKTILNQDPKSRLDTFSYLQCKQSRAKYSGPVYRSVEHPGHYEASVTLHCMEGKHFVGKPAATKKQAEANAATIALQTFRDQVAAVLAHAKKTDLNQDPKTMLPHPLGPTTDP